MGVLGSAVGSAIGRSLAAELDGAPCTSLVDGCSVGGGDVGRAGSGALVELVGTGVAKRSASSVGGAEGGELGVRDGTNVGSRVGDPDG